MQTPIYANRMKNIEYPLVSIIMPSLNQDRFIKLAMNSVLNQNYPNLELIVIDGGSQDNTLSILKEYCSQDTRLRWLSRKDNGPAYAINDALAKVRGTFIGWLNSDDLYATDSIAKAMDALQINPEWLMVYGQGQHIDDQGKMLDVYPTLPASTSIQQFSNGCFICQPSVFFKYSMFKLLGKLDESLKTSFDFEYWLRAFSVFPERIGFIDHIQAYSRLHNECITLNMRRTVALEAMQILNKYLGTAPRHWILTYFNELLALEITNVGLSDFKTHMLLTIDEAVTWLTPKELSKLKIEILESPYFKPKA